MIVDAVQVVTRTDSPREILTPDDIESIPLTVEHFSHRLGCMVRGSNRAIPPNIEYRGVMDPGIYVTVYIHGNSAAGSSGIEKMRSHTLTALAFREQTSWTAVSGSVPAIALGVCMEREQLSRFGMQDLLEDLFHNDQTVLKAQAAADFRTIAEAWEILRADMAKPVDLLRLETHALDIFSKGMEILQSCSGDKKSQLRTRLLAMCDAVEADISRDWTMADFAQEAGMSIRSLSEKFRIEFDMTPFEFLRERRLLRARDAIINGDQQIGDAARLVGYSSSAHFCTAFKKQFGVTPGACRLETKHH